ncbi:XdhC family protein (plasmid) [Agrobacterium tumefaciens]|nr:XdhC family protein [Agrobacterium tumefaciens]
MVMALPPKTMPLPVRQGMGDDPEEILRFAADEVERDGAALAILVDIRGGAARALGTFMAIAADGRFCGYVSGGCVESAVATEALQALDEGRDRMVKFGEGSPFFDIVLPCGGGITVAIHVLRDSEVLRQALRHFAERQPVTAQYSPAKAALALASDVTRRSGWQGGDFLAVRRPRTRVVVSGQTAEAMAVTRLAEASGYDVANYTAVDLRYGTAGLIDPFSAVVLLHHDLDLEAPALRLALNSPAFYIGALGSKRTHTRRLERLIDEGIPLSSFSRIKAPIGLFGPTRDSMSLAISVLADITAARIAAQL